MFNRKDLLRSISLGMATLLIAGSSVLAGCTSLTDNTTPSAAEESKQDKLPEFIALVGENSKPDVLIKYIDENISGVTPKDASVMLEELEKAQKNYLPVLENKYFEGDEIQKSLSKIYKPGFDLESAGNIEDAELRSLLEETRNMGYRLETAEGTFFPIMNYEGFKKYSPYASEDMKDYIDIMSVETNKVPAKDAALVIGWDEVISRALAQESFIEKYGSSKKLESIKELNKKYITFILYGLNNTPLFSYDTKTMDSDAKKAYTEALEGNKDSELLKLLSRYMELLKKTGYKLTEEVEKFRKEASGSF